VQKFQLDLPGANKPILAAIQDDVTLEYYPAEEPVVKCLLNWEKNLMLPIQKGHKLGEITVQNEDGKIMRTIPLFALEDVKATHTHQLKSLFLSESSWFKFALVGSILLLLLFYVLYKLTS